MRIARARHATAIVFARPGHALEQDVPVGEQPDQHLAQELFLPDDDPANLRQQPVKVLAMLPDELPDLLDFRCA